jgi:cyclophilin family peptidyl-prolyl cis-trans isomerase
MRTRVVGRRLRLLLTLGLLATTAPVGAAPESPRVGEEKILLRTSRGDLVLGLYPEVAPRHVAQILKLVRLGVYDSMWFHRVEPGFLVQTTDAQNRKQPLTPEQLAAIVKLPLEVAGVTHQAGVLSMARRDGDLDSAETSFSILLGAAPHLDGKYTVFGQLEWGLPLLGLLASEPRDAKNAPLTTLVVESALVKTAAEIAQLIESGALLQARPLPAAALAVKPAVEVMSGMSTLAIVAVVLMLLFNLAGFLLAGRLSQQTRGALNLLPVLIGFFLLLAELGPGASRTPLLGLGLFVGVVALFKLMNRFESAPPPPPADRPPGK